MHVGSGSGTESLQLCLRLRLALGLRGVNVNAPPDTHVQHTPASTHTGLLIRLPLGLFSLAFRKYCVLVCVCMYVCLCVGVCVFL